MSAIYSFELTMPSRGSWNGQWSGQQKRYFIYKRIGDKSARKLMPLEGQNRQNFFYNFGDGWSANVAVTKIDGKTKREQVKINAGFCGYDWMVDSIIWYGEILTEAPKTEATTA